MELKGRRLASIHRESLSFNRTFMELKVSFKYCVKSSSVFQSHLYGIESANVFQRLGVHRVSIAPLWNWKATRTELGQYQHCFNRTFMELKVSFSPLPWYVCMCFNRTFMELKVLLPVPVFPARYSFNRTFMELKVYCTTHARGSPQSFNRTFMELKDGGEPDAPLPYDVSIAPLWNWKSVEPWEGLERGAFQSHLYGIERLLRFSSSAGMTVSIAPLWNWKLGMAWSRATASRFQSHLYGIESQYEVQALAHLKVSIAPLWNWKYAIWVGNYSAKGHGGVSSLK